MAENETDSLLKDLESRSAAPGGSKSAASDEGGEDIEAFLRSLEGDDYVAPPKEEKPAPAPAATKTKTKTKTADPLDDRFNALEAAPDAPLEKAAPEKKGWRAKRAEKKAAKAAEKSAKEAAKEAAKAGEPAVKDDDVAVVEDAEKGAGLRKAVRVLKWTAVLVPLFAAWWILGAYLSNWVSAGWLVFLLATTVVFGLPLALWKGVKKGRYIWWTAGSSALVAIGLVAPLPGPSSDALGRYGHWPTTAIGEVAGLTPDSPLVRASAAVGGFIGSWIQPPAEAEPPSIPHKLGTDVPLRPEDAKPDPNAPKPDAPKPENPTPDAPKPDPTVPPPAPTPEAPTPTPTPTPTPEAPTPEAPTPEAPTPEAPKPDAPKPADPKPAAPTPEAPAPTPEAPAP